MKFKICIIDLIGLTYDGTTLSKIGLGGSESAVILMARELAKLGNDVTVFNHCEDSKTSPGVYDGVRYAPHRTLKEEDFEFDIMISSRTVIPFLNEFDYIRFQPDQYGRFHNCSLFEKIRKTAKYKVVWMHDTFCMGEDLVEKMLLNGQIDQIFTLSDFHSTYVTNSHHGDGAKRNYEVLKNKFFQTRNGIVNYIPEVDISRKDPHHCIYNASISKGMVPLVTEIWPKIQQSEPNAHLTIIGGYYRFSETSQPDAQELQYRKLVEHIDAEKLNITFTGIIPQFKIAEICANASFFLFPGEFPETSGISTMESLAYNTPLITTRFGALEETAIDSISYMIDYAISPTPLSPYVDHNAQINKFVDITLKAFENRYLHQQKMYACNAIKDIITWDTVALQWQQQFCKTLYKYFPVDLYKKVTYINNKVRRVFGRRITNSVEWGTEKIKNFEQPIAVVSPFYNCENYIENCILSVAQQNYDNYLHLLINDKSIDNSLEIAQNTIDSLPENIRSKFIIINNEENVGAVANQVNTIRNITNDECIIMLLDGDDSLVNNNTLFNFYNELYESDTDFTYGSSWSMADNIPLQSQQYPTEIINSKTFREHQFNWGLPYTHLRTFRKRLINNISDTEFQDEDGFWYRSGGDNAVFYNLIEQARPNGIKVVNEIVYNYNDLNPINDYKVNGEEQNRVAIEIKNKKKVKTKETTLKTILIAVPTQKYIETDTFKSIYDLKIPEGYVAEFQYFYGYRIDQIRNLIADWVVNKFDYLFSVDSDITFAPDTLEKLLSHDKDIVCGIYKQRFLEKEVLEVYDWTNVGGMSNVSYDHLNSKAINNLAPVAGCGFGCTLVKKEVFVDVGAPQFEYHVALTHDKTVSEDTDFCLKATKVGRKVFCDTSVLCGHIGSITHYVRK